MTEPPGLTEPAELAEPAGLAEPPGVRRPSREDPLVRAASEVVGGPVGNHLAAGSSRWLGAAPLLALAACATVALALGTRAHCLRAGWTTPGMYVHACYSDVPLLVGAGDVAGQTPGTAVLLRLLSVLTTTGSPARPDGRAAFEAAVLLAAASLVAATWCVVAVAGRRRWDAALVALSPAVVTAGLVSVDLVAVAATAGAVLAWARGRALASGLLLGGAAAVRPALGVLLVAVWLVVLVRAEERPDDGGVLRPPRAPEAVAATTASLAALVAAGVVTLLARVGTPGLPGGSHWLPGRGAGYGSLWLLPSLAGRPLPAAAVTALWLVALGVVALLGVAAAARTAQRDPAGRADLPAVALVLLAGTLVVAPSLPVQATLVVLPVAALALPSWREQLPWALAECAYATGTWLYLGGLAASDHRGAPPWAYGALLVVRLAAVASLAVLGLRRATRRVAEDGSGGPVVPRPAAQRRPAATPEEPPGVAPEEPGGPAARPEGPRPGEAWGRTPGQSARPL